ncbi:MAG: immunoglobulin domain-containing protein [Planctomycetaceae bacterium]|nr:immunoglobulin domain-containing protein [Planctomycetaceae bacterium]
MKKKLCVVMMGLCFLALLGATPRADLVARYTFDEGTAADDSGNGNNGALNGSGATIVLDPVRGMVLDLNGDSQVSYMRVPNSATLNAVASQSTIAMWVYWSGSLTAQLIEKGGTSSRAWDTAPWGIRRETDNTLRASWGNQLPEPMLLSSPVPLDTWTHVAIVYDSTLGSDQRKFYINGVLDTHSNWTGTASTNTYDLFVGCDYYNSTPRWPFTGRIDDIQIFNTALSDSEIGVVMTGSGITNADPINGARFVPVSKVLSWDPPAEWEPNYVFSGYDVYFDVNDVKVKNGLVKRVSNDSLQTYDPSPTGDLDNSTTYYWRVDIVGQYDYASEPNILKGAVYSFTTISLEPTITLQPLSQVRGVLNGKPDAVLSVEAVNATDYQWYKDTVALSDGGNISGATTNTLTIAGVQLSNEGQYYCAVSNSDSPTSVNSNTVWVEFARQTSGWSFENDYVDAIGGYNGSIADVNSTPAFVMDSKEGSYALSFDGVDNRLLLPPAALSRAGTEMTFTLWTKNNTPTVASTTLYGYADARKNYRLINIHTPWTNNTAYLDVANTDVPGTSDYDRVGGTNAVVTTGDPYWVHWIFTKDHEGDRMRVYRNGVQIGSSTENDWRYYGADNLMLGASWTYDAPTQVYSLHQFYNGVIDDLRFYNYYMDEVEAAYLYHDATGQTEKVCINDADPIVAAYDFNDNCKIDLGDLAELAAVWLHCKQVPACVDRP